jgi:outer membrane protein OmpA-like peptidoglycan-associated protein
MNNKLFEEINRFKLLSGYDTKKTLSEQMMILSEQDKNWRVWSYNGVPICATGPNGEFIPTAKGTELGYKTYSDFNDAYRNASEDEKASYTSVKYDKKIHQKYFGQEVKSQGKQVNQNQEDSTETPTLTGDKVKVGTINLSAANGAAAEFKNGTLFGGIAEKTNFILGQTRKLQSFKVAVGAIPITTTGTTVTPPVYNSINISFGESTMSDPFVIGKAELKPEAKAKLDEYIIKVLDFKKQNGDEAYKKYIEFLSSKKPIGVNGYASRDSDPKMVYRNGKTAEQNDLELSQQRAGVIVNYLVDKLPELNGILAGVGKGQTTQFGGEESGWPATDKTKYGVNRRFVIEIPNFSFDKSVLVTPEITTNWEKQGKDLSGVRPKVYDERGRPTNMGTAAVANKDIPKEFASKNEIAVAEQMYETDLGTLSPNLSGVKLKHYKDPNGFFIVSKEEMKLVEEYIPIVTQGTFNNTTKLPTTITSKSLSIVANGKTYMWNGWNKATANDNSGLEYDYVTEYKLAAIRYVDSPEGKDKSITPDGYLLGQVGWGIQII